MPVVQKMQPLNVEDYLALEREADVKHEYIDGEIFAMVGASRAHTLIIGNLHAALHSHLRGGPCRVLMADMKVRIDSANAFYYPDMLVSCTAVASEPDNYYESQPRLIIEVLSPTTEARDRLEKRLNYQTLASLEEYMLVAQNKIEVDIYRRATGQWQHERLSAGAEIVLHSITFELPIAALYEDVNTIG